MTEQTDVAEVEALIPWLSDLVTFAVGAYAETMVGAREPGDPSDWADDIAREFCDARRPVELAAREAAARAEALREAAEELAATQHLPEYARLIACAIVKDRIARTDGAGS